MLLSLNTSAFLLFTSVAYSMILPRSLFHPRQGTKLLVNHASSPSSTTQAIHFQFDRSLYESLESKTITDKYSIGDAPNGGYLMAKAMVAAQGVTKNKDPFSATAHFVAKAKEHCEVDFHSHP